jgi:DNA-binding transcriptional MerR regulator
MMKHAIGEGNGMEKKHITTREAAERLRVHARTIRKWIDVFEDYIHPEVNDRGHYIFTEEGFRRLADIQNRLQKPNKSMRQVRQELIQEGKLEQTPTETPEFLENIDPNTKVAPFMSAEKAYRYIMDTVNYINDTLEELSGRMQRMEDQVFNLYGALEKLENKMATQKNALYAPAKEVQSMFDEIRKMHEQLKAELRNVSFSQRLAAATESKFVPRKERKPRAARFFGIF